MAEAIRWEILTFFISGVLGNLVFIICGIVALFKASERKPFERLLVKGFLWNLIPYLAYLWALKRYPERYVSSAGSWMGDIFFLIVVLCLIVFGCYRLDKKAAEKAEAEARAQAMEGRKP